MEKQMNSSTDHSRSVPQLRFPKFDGEWEKKKLGEVAPLQRGFDLPVDNIKVGDFPVVFSNGILKHHNEYKAKAPGVVTGRSGTIGKVTYVEKDYWPHNTSLWVTDFRGNLPKFIFYFYSKYSLERLGTGSGVPTLNRNDVHIQEEFFPSYLEQTKIANFLTAVDGKIQALKKKKSLLEDYKKGVMQKLFSQELRFKDEEGKNYANWQNRKLRDALNEHKLKSTGIEEVYSVSVHKGLINQIEHLGRSFASKDVNNYNLVQPDDLVYTKSPTGNFPLGIIKQSNIIKNVIVSPLYGVFTPESKGLGYLLNVHFESSINTANYLGSLIQKGAKNTINITNQTFLSKEMKMPISIEEQNKIGNFLSAIDDKIKHTDTQIKKMEAWKKGLLQKMFV